MVRLTAALVGPPHPGLVLRLRRDDRAPRAAPDRCEDCGDPELVREEDVLDTWFSSALWPFATLGWPDETPDLRAFYPGDVNSTAREIIFLWVARMIMAGLELLGDDAVRGRDHPLDGARARRAADVEEPRDRHRPARGDRRPRRRRDALRPLQDVVDAGRRASRRGDRGGAPAREQALERVPAAPRNAAATRRGATRRADRALDPRPDRAARAEVEADLAASTSRRPPTRSTTSRSTTSATGMPRRSSRGSTSGDRRRDCDRALRARAAALAAAPGHAARHRGDLVAPPGPDGAADRRRPGRTPTGSRRTRASRWSASSRPRDVPAKRRARRAERAGDGGSSSRSSGPIGSGSTATPTRSASA